MRTLLFLSLILFSPRPLHPQWSVALLGGTASSHGDARDATDPAHAEIRAERPATLAIAVIRTTGAWQLRAELRHIAADLGESSGSSAFTTRNALAAWGVAAEAGRRVVGHGATASLSVTLGAVLDRWSFDLDNEAPRQRASLRGGAELALPITARWRALIREEILLGASVFRRDELPDGFVPRAAVRIGLMLGVARRL